MLASVNEDLVYKRYMELSHADNNQQYNLLENVVTLISASKAALTVSPIHAFSGVMSSFNKCNYSQLCYFCIWTVYPLKTVLPDQLQRGRVLYTFHLLSGQQTKQLRLNIKVTMSDE